MKITGDMVTISPDVYGGYVIYKNGKKVVYIELLR